MPAFLEALFLQSGYNAALVTIGAGLLGLAAGGAGTFLFLRNRALVSDAIAHATLPGIGLAFIIVVGLGGDGRNLMVLLFGSAISAGLGLLAVEWIARQTRLSEDAAIGAVLSVFFGFGIVLLTVIQSMSSGRQAGLESFLLGSTAGMLFQDGLVIALGGAVALGLVFVLRRPMTITAFDSDYGVSLGIDTRLIDLAMMALVMIVTVIGLKIVGLILVVALLIIPPVSARFWTERTERVIVIAGILGGVSGYLGAAISASAPNLPTGPIIVLVNTGAFLVSLLFAPQRGLLASLLRQRQFQLRVHRRQGLLALAHGEPIYDRLTIAVLRREGLIRPDGVATDAGRGQAAKALLDEKRWEIARSIHQEGAVANQYDGLSPIEIVLTPDELSEIDRRLGPPEAVGGTVT
jgi:manganese/zinc/iron transport system permease protein